LKPSHNLDDTTLGNRAFYGASTSRGHVVVIDSPREVANSAVPIACERDVIVHGAYLAEPVGATLLRLGLRGFIGVDAGGGRNGAGYGGLQLADRFAVPAAVASVFTCDMCDGASVWRDGVISHANAAAAACGVEPGAPVRQAAELMLNAEPGQPRAVQGTQPDGEFLLHEGATGSVFGCWSMGIPKGERGADVFCVGTPMDAMMAIYVYRNRLGPKAVIGSDGGFGRNRMAVAGLQILQSIGVPAAAVDHLSADLGDARSIYEDGIITAANGLAIALGAAIGQRARQAAEQLLTG
jgi:hypothetical protein